MRKGNINKLIIEFWIRVGCIKYKDKTEEGWLNSSGVYRARKSIIKKILKTAGLN